MRRLPFAHDFVLRQMAFGGARDGTDESRITSRTKAQRHHAGRRDWPGLDPMLLLRLLLNEMLLLPI